MKLFGFQITRERNPEPRRSFDTAASNRHLDNHFAFASGADADSALLPSLETLRNRCRHEMRNNCNARRMVWGLANDIVGTGPRLQIKTGDKDLDRRIEKRWNQWARKCDFINNQGLRDHLILSIIGLCDSGAVLLVPKADDRGSVREPRVRFMMIETDRLNTPFQESMNPAIKNGIEFDDEGRPVRYYVQKEHPGSSRLFVNHTMDDYNVLEADQACYVFRVERPGQSHGIPWLSPSLELFAILRRYVLAVLSAAETGANFSGVIQTDGALGQVDNPSVLETFDIERNQLMTLPKGWQLSQFKSENPPPSFREFRQEILNEAAGCVLQPFNVAIGNSSGYNYASGRLDWQSYYRLLQVVRDWIGEQECDYYFWAWFYEGLMIPGYFGDISALSMDTLEHAWNWQGAEHVDPKKEADAAEVRRKSTTNDAIECARLGLDWEEVYTQRAKEQERRRELGIEAITPPTNSQSNGDSDNEDAEENDAAESAVAADAD